ncbi:nuclear transport factor 2 family protein [Mucilaginibacter lutimaris]|uniref:Nuclear transport factor 2 family protein n=1 Tax=Mucilaginibacter lutimaris TaxID=931629 RepID=A0ABW2ZKG5_9SPHI
MDELESIVKSYIEAYNKFDIEGMLIHMDEAVVFENVSGGEVNMTLNGIEEFRNQALQAVDLFSSRKQTIANLTQAVNQIIIDIAYHGVLAIDLPNGMKQGDELNLTGRSTFTFAGDKIIRLRDES